MTHTIRIEKQSGHNSSAADENDIFPVQILRKRLWEGEITPPTKRYDATDDEVQQTTDEGSTWIPDPTSDPRHDDNFRRPALDTTDPKCDAAANMVAYLQHYVDVVVNAGSYSFIAASTMVDLVLIVTGIGVIADLILIIAEAFIGIGLTAIGDAFTSEVYDQLLCIFYGNIGADGQVSAAQLSAIQEAIDSDIGGTPATVMDLLIQLWGEVILSNVGASGTETGNCFACTYNGCQQWLLNDVSQLADEMITVLAGTPASSSTSRWIIADSHEGGQNMCHVKIDIPSGVTVTRVSMSWTNAGGGVPRGVIMRNASTWDGSNHLATAYSPTLGCTATGSWTGGYIGFQVNSNYNSVNNLGVIQMDFDYTTAPPWIHPCP